MDKSKRKILVMVIVLVMFFPAAYVIAANSGNSAYKLEGVWVSKVISMDGQPDAYPFQWSLVFSPDPSGKSASVHGSVEVAFPGGLGHTVGFVSPLIGEIVKTGANTAAFNSYWYYIAYGDDSTGYIDQVVSIGRSWGVVEYVGPGEAVSNHHFEIYLAEADADGDGIPDPGSEPIDEFTATTHDKRIPSPAE